MFRRGPGGMAGSKPGGVGSGCGASAARAKRQRSARSFAKRTRGCKKSPPRVICLRFAAHQAALAELSRLAPAFTQGDCRGSVGDAPPAALTRVSATFPCSLVTLRGPRRAVIYQYAEAGIPTPTPPGTRPPPPPGFCLRRTPAPRGRACATWLGTPPSLQLAGPPPGNADGRAEGPGGRRSSRVCDDGSPRDPSGSRHDAALAGSA
jgi:hypothetical protein